MLIIEKTAVTLGEKEEMNDILSKCQSLKGEYTDISQCLDELVERHNELKAKKYRQYIFSFKERKEDVLIDVKEILDAVEKRDFEDEQDRRRAVWSEPEGEKTDEFIEKLLKKNFSNFLSFLAKITAPQKAVIEYDYDKDGTFCESGSELKKNMPESDRILFDRYVDMLIEKAEALYRKPGSFSVSGLYSSLSDRPSGSLIIQNKAVNALSHVSNRSFSGSDDIFSEKAVAFQENVEITIDDIGDSKFTVSTQKVKDLMLEHLAQQLPRGVTASTDSVALNREVTLTVKEVAERFRTGMKEARQMLNEAVTTLYNASVRWKELSCYTNDGRRKNEPEIMEYEHRYLSGMGKTSEETPVVKGKAKVIFDYDFAFLLSRSGYVMFYHPNLYRINANINRHSYYLGRKMCEHYNGIVRDYEAETIKNGTKIITKNANRLSVKNLIKVCPDLPGYDEVMESDRAVRRRIIEPFERDMYALSEKYGILTTWRYCNKKGKPLSDEQWQSLSYNDWVTLYIEFEIADYPDQTKRLENKAAKIENSVRKNRKKK